MNCRGLLSELDTPQVMGILNVTLDSFYAASRFQEEKTILDRAEQILEEGGSIIDVGAQSTRPGAKEVGPEEETKILTNAIQLIRKEFPKTIISADTYRAQTAIAVVEGGADIINDISGGTMDGEMFSTVSRLSVPYILMHIQGTPANMQTNPQYEDVVKEVMLYFADKVLKLRKLGVKDIILDPGFGFGKTVEHNYQLLNSLDHFNIFDLPILAGLSRKSMINKVLYTKPEEALNGTTVLNTIALTKGVSILRVHDVKEAVEAIKLTALLHQSA